jgi:single-stranded-DNA-specific exonuclease
MKKGVTRVLEAIDKNQKVIIYGDYDADGVCSSALLYRALRELGLKKVKVYIPDRETEGHGFNNYSINWILKQKPNLVITVDCGSRDTKEIAQLKKNNIDVLITDHHETGEKFPPAVALINPYRQDDKYPFTHLAGAGVAFKLASAIYWVKQNDYWDSRRKKITKISSFVLPEQLKWYLDITALATVADVMPLLGENRTLVKYGLGVLAQSKWVGIKELMSSAQIKPEVTLHSQEGEAPLTNLDSYTLGFLLAPRLNAAGRMDHANIAFHLLITDSESKAKELAEKINQANLDRQRRLEKIVQEVETRLGEKYQQDELPKLICEGSKDWSVGLIGLVAGKLANKYGRPAVVYQDRDKENLICASFRSVPKFSVIDLLEKHSDFFDDYGGHKEAAGFRMNSKNFLELKQSLTKVAEKELQDKELEPTLEVDKEVSLEEINWRNYNLTQKLAPFGNANPAPKFLAKDLEIRDWRMVGNGGKHLKLDLAMFSKNLSSAKNFKAIAFGFGEILEQKLNQGAMVDIVFELISNEWNGYKNLEFKILDIKLR